MLDGVLTNGFIVLVFLVLTACVSHVSCIRSCMLPCCFMSEWPQYGDDTSRVAGWCDLLAWIRVACERRESILLIPIICVETRLDHSGETMWCRCGYINRLVVRFCKRHVLSGTGASPSLVHRFHSHWPASGLFSVTRSQSVGRQDLHNLFVVAFVEIVSTLGRYGGRHGVSACVRRRGVPQPCWSYWSS